MQNLSMEQKAKMYNQLLFKYQRLQEQVRQIKAEDINLSEQNQRKIGSWICVFVSYLGDICIRVPNVFCVS